MTGFLCAAGCSRNSPPASAATGGPPADAGKAATSVADGNAKEAVTSPIDPNRATKKFGAAPVHNDHIVYQPDVVTIDDGPRAIRGVSSNGLTFRIDGHARGADQLAVGKVMLAASLAAGRIVELQKQGGDVVVRLAPVQFSEIIRKADIHLDQELSPATLASIGSGGGSELKAYVYRTGGPHATMLPAVWRSASEGGGFFLLAGTGAAPNASHGPGPDEGPNACVDPGICEEPQPDDSAGPTVTSPQENSHSGSVPIGGGFEVELFANSTPSPIVSHPNGNREILPEQGSEIGVKLTKNIERGGKPTGLKFGLGLRLSGQKIRLQEHLVVDDGRLNDEQSDLSIVGLEMMKVGFLAGSSDGLKDNLKVRLEYSPSKQIQGPDGMVLTLGFKIFVDFAFTSKDSTVWGNGAYRITGPLGVVGGTAQTPKIEVITPVSTSLGGVSIGPIGFVVGVEPKVMLGFGIADVLNGGFYGKLRGTFGIARGSVLGTPLVDCRGVTWKIEGGLGVGVNYTVTAATLAALLGKTNTGEIEVAEAMVPIWSPPTSTTPDVPICRGD
jgi:hypothetical protein